VEVVLCLRGADDSLDAALAGLAAQHYRGPWRLQVIVDSTADPAWPRLQAWQPEGVRVLRQPLQQRPTRGSLKCAALRQAIRLLEPDTAVMAVVDADAVVGRHWLSELVQGCLQPGVGAVSGNRWYEPERARWGAAIRAVWNAGVVLAMSLGRVPWGGSLALRREVVEAGPWQELLECGLCEDTGLLGPLRALGLRYVFLPNLVIVDRDASVELWSLAHWIQRQLLTVRLHHPVWPLALAYGVGSLILPLLSLAGGRWVVVVLYEAGLLATLWTVGRLLRGSGARWPAHWWAALLPAQLIHAGAIMAAWLARRIEWRGVVYRVQRQPPGVAIERIT
jgi:cellulose synthase/poly-beta-1,6-N-acetylglucosamine synthase-like glycosyltransferase